MKSLIMTIAYCIVAIFSNAQTITQAEYFIDTDRGFGNNTLVTLPASADSTYDFTVNLSGVTAGYHLLYIRTKDNNGKWSLTTRRSIEVLPTIAENKVTGAEYFFNTDPGFGNGNQVNFTVPSSDAAFDFNIPLTNIPIGANTVYFRTKDSLGHWSITQWQKDSVVTSSGLDTVWSHAATWSNNKVPDSNTVVLLYHKVYVDVDTATCKSLTPYRNNARCIVWPDKKLTITGRR